MNNRESQSNTTANAAVPILFSHVNRAVQYSHKFPGNSTPSYVYYNDDQNYRDVMNANSNRILSIIQNIMKEVGPSSYPVDIKQFQSLDEKFNTLVTINDGVLDRLTGDMNRVELEFNANNNQAQGTSMTQSQSFQPTSVKRLIPKNVERPQKSFKVPPDNSHGHFTPILKEKPNAIVALKDCTLTADSDTGDYDHPYGAELDFFERHMNNFQRAPLMNGSTFLPLENTPLIYVDNVSSLKSMVEELKRETEIAVDLEHHSFRTYLGITCLMQISSRTKDYIVDTIALRDELGVMNTLFTDPNIVKVLHGSDLDLMWLQRDFGVYMVNLFDTGQASRVLQFKRYSLAFLLEEFVGITPNKEFQKADWRMRPLSPEMIFYARSDTHYLLYIADELRRILMTSGLLNEVLMRSHGLCKRIYKKPTMNKYFYLEKAHAECSRSLNNRQVYALKHLCLLRDKIAREEDESNGFILPNHMLHTIAQMLPREPTGLLACCHPVPIYLSKYLMEFHKVIVEAREGKHVEQEIAEDKAKYEALFAASNPFNNYTLTNHVSRSAPHEGPKTASGAATAYGSATAHSYAPIDPMSRSEYSSYNLGVPYSQLPTLYEDPDRGLTRRVLNNVQYVPVANTICMDQSLYSEMSMPSTPVMARSDPLFKSPSPNSTLGGAGVNASAPIRLTGAEALEVGSLFAKFMPGAGIRSPQASRDPATRPPKEQYSSKVAHENESEVTILRDFLTKKSKPQARQRPPTEVPELTANSSPPNNAPGRTEVPVTTTKAPEASARRPNNSTQHQQHPAAGAGRRRRDRGGGAKGGARGGGNNTAASPRGGTLPQGRSARNSGGGGATLPSTTTQSHKRRNN